jgi:nucleoid-associated protein YgaU
MKDKRRAKKRGIHEKRAIFLAFFFFISSFFFCMAQTADNLDSAFAAAEENRRIAVDFEGNSYFPGEWEDAESQYARAGLMPKDSDDAISAYNEAAAAFKRLFELAIPLYAQAREDEIMAQRDYLITLGARDSFHEYLLDADRTALLALTQYEAKDYYPARDSAAEALQKFNVLETAFNSWLLRQEIRARGFAGYDPDNFELGGEIISGAMDAYMAGDLAGAREKAEEAISTYNMVLSTSWASYAELRSSLAEGERLAALDMKTDIAAKEFFKIADSENKIALELLESEKYEDAAKLFISAEAMFVIASITTLEKRRAAATAIRNAAEKIQESDKIAEIIIEGSRSNEYLVESRRLAKLAEEAFPQGDYDTSARLANDAVYLAIQSDVHIAITMAKRYIDRAAASGVSARFSHEYREAEDWYKQSTNARDNEEWEIAIGAANMVVQLLDGLGTSGGSVPLPATYTVRPWAVSKDCFWNIAGFPWVYGDPYQWRLLYNANKSKLPNPNNPNILEPGTVLDIPSIKGEVRQGVWESGKTYETFR